MCIRDRFYILRAQEESITGNGGSVFDSISRTQIEQLPIPLPPLPIQEALVAEVESYQREIEQLEKEIEQRHSSISKAIERIWIGE